MIVEIKWMNEQLNKMNEFLEQMEEHTMDEWSAWVYLLELVYSQN